MPVAGAGGGAMGQAPSQAAGGMGGLMEMLGPMMGAMGGGGQPQQPPPMQPPGGNPQIVQMAMELMRAGQQQPQTRTPPQLGGMPSGLNVQFPGAPGFAGGRFGY